MPDEIGAGETVLLLAPDGKRHVVLTAAKPQRIAGLGVLATNALVGKAWGSKLKLGRQEYLLTRPALVDYVASLERGPQIITPKDAARILFETGVHAGSRVIEGGVGSGALTVALAHAVTPGGRVYAYDNRKDHLDLARANLERASLGSVVEFRLGDARRDLKETDVDAVVLDLPDPEAAVAAAHKALRPGGVLAVYVPLVDQVQRAVAALRGLSFVDIRSLELLERSWTFHERGARPDFDMLGHTGFLTFARRV